jgi:hypothetical protein
VATPGIAGGGGKRTASVLDAPSVGLAVLAASLGGASGTRTAAGGDAAVAVEGGGACWRSQSVSPKARTNPAMVMKNGVSERCAEVLSPEVSAKAGRHPDGVFRMDVVSAKPRSEICDE